MVWVVSLFTTDVITRRVSPVIHIWRIRSLHRLSKSSRPHYRNSALPHQINFTRRYLNSFRGEPAISRLD